MFELDVRLNEGITGLRRRPAVFAAVPTEDLNKKILGETPQAKSANALESLLQEKQSFLLSFVSRNSSSRF